MIQKLILISIHRESQKQLEDPGRSVCSVSCLCSEETEPHGTEGPIVIPPHYLLGGRAWWELGFWAEVHISNTALCCQMLFWFFVLYFFF